MELVPGEQVERYVIESRIGAGRMSTTYRVRHVTLDTFHALTVPNEPIKALRVRLVAGARIAARLRHPHVIAATDVLELRGEPALVLDHVEGPSLEDYWSSHELSEQAIDALAAGMLDGLAFIHRNGVVHRNLKPRNVIVDLGGDIAVPRITDFTLAKVMGKPMRKRKRKRVFGTAQYMSPEQTIDADSVDPRADVWSAACLLYQLCSGWSPFDGPSNDDIFEAVRAGRYVPLRNRVPTAPKRWADAIAAALVVDREKRCETINHLADMWFDGTTERPKMAAKTPPVGQIALVFTDIQGSTRIWEANEDLARHSLRAHDAVMRASLHRHGGYEVKTEGDAFMVAFKDPSKAVGFCIDVQRELHAHPWSGELLALPEASEGPGFRGLRVRMGVHVGEPEARARGDQIDYFGPMVNRSARIASAGHGGQILVSESTWQMARTSLVEAPHVSPLGAFKLRGLAGNQRIVQVLPAELAQRSFPPVKATAAH
jgi:serine/threonine protein kinase